MAHQGLLDNRVALVLALRCVRLSVSIGVRHTVFRAVNTAERAAEVIAASVSR